MKKATIRTETKIIGYAGQGKSFCADCAKKGNKDIDYRYLVLTGEEENNNISVCDVCHLAIPCLLSIEGRNRIFDTNFESDYELWGPEGSGYYAVYGQFADHDPDSWFGPFDTQELMIQAMVNDYLDTINWV